MLVITYADGTREDTLIQLENPQSLHSWRLPIGTAADPGPPAPSPVSPPP
jgi:hypothetical protein